MKNNNTAQRIDEMHFDRVTFVFAEYAGKAHTPINPAATLVACKGAPVDKNPIKSAIVGAFEALGLAKKSKPAEGETDATKATADEAIENAGYSALFSLLYNLEYDVSAIACAGLDDAAKKAAITSLVMNFYDASLALAGSIFGEKASIIEAAVKAGARNSAADLAEIKTAEKSLGDIVDAATKGREAIAKLLDEGAKSGVVETPAENAPAIEPAVKSAEEIAADAEAARKAAESPAAQPDVAALIAAAVKSIDLSAQIADAVKSAVEPLHAQITDATAKVATAEKAAADAVAAQGVAEKALSDAVDTARERQGAGGHQDAIEAKNDVENGRKSGADAVAKPTTIREAIALLHS